MEHSTELTEVQIVPGGPILMKGTLRVTQADGSIETREGNTAFCRCGASTKKPYCDGTHRKIDFA